jgi:hypothetical protein
MLWCSWFIPRLPRPSTLTELSRVFLQPPQTSCLFDFRPTSRFFCGLMQRVVVVPYRRCGVSCRAPSSSTKNPKNPWRCDPIGCPETSLRYYRYTLRDIAEEGTCLGGWFVFLHQMAPQTPLRNQLDMYISWHKFYCETTSALVEIHLF